MRRSLLLLPLSLFAALAAPGCQPLQTLDAAVCGNGVIDTAQSTNGVTDEDCDGHPIGGFACRGPTEAWPCTFSCKAGACPTGFGCGTDGVCRRSTGVFEKAAFAHGPSQAQELYSGDFDADGKRDVLGVEPGRARIHFTGDTEVLQQVSVLSPTRPSIGKLGTVLNPAKNGVVDATDDLVLPLNIGLGSLLSNGDRTFTPETYGSIAFGQIPFPIHTELPDDMQIPILCDVLQAIPVAFNAVSGDQNPGDETAALFAVQPNDPMHPDDHTDVKDGYFANFSAGGSGLVFRVKGTLPKQLSGLPVTSDFDNDGCDEIVFPHFPPSDAGADFVSTLDVYKTCVQSPKGIDWMRFGNGIDPVLVTIDTGGLIKGPAFIHDVNGDMNDDLLITVQAVGPDGKKQLQLRVAYSLGNGQFDSTGSALADEKAGVLAVLDSAPLAVGDINKDGRPDVVTGTLVLLGKQGATEPLAFDAVYQSPRLWSEAYITNVNGDSHPDVAACTDGAPDIDVLIGNDSPLPNPFKISTDGTVANLRVGDFDGDLVPDLAFQDALTEQSSLLMISYGRTSGGPEDPHQIGTFQDIQAVAVGNVLSLGVDAISDLGVVSNLGDELSLSFFPGAANRVMQTPYLLAVSVDQDPKERGKVHIPLQTAMGFLRPWDHKTAARNDVAVIAVSPLEGPVGSDFEQALKYRQAFRLWGLFGAGEGAFDPDQSVHCKLPDGSFAIPPLRQGESILVPDAPAGQTGPTWVIVPFLKLPEKLGESITLSTLVAQAHFDGKDACSVDTNHFTRPGELLLRARGADLNGNGIPEILAIHASFSLGYLQGLIQQSAAGIDGTFAGIDKSDLVVFWDGDLGAGETLTPYEPPGQPPTVNDFAVGDIDGDGKPEVIVAGHGPTVAYSLGDDKKSFVVRDPLSVDVADARAILLADADGDGVQDLAVASGTQLQIYRGVSKPAVKTPPAAK